MSSPFAVVSRTMSVAVGLIVKMSNAEPFLSPRLLPNAICVPSGDQAGIPSGGFVNVSACDGPVRVHHPDVGPPMRSLMKAIFWPSGDHVGWMSCFGVFVSRVWPVPSAFMT